MATKTAFDKLGEANANEACEWLLGHSALHYDAVLNAVKQGATPEEIYLFVLRDVGEERKALAHRCRLAARAMVEEN